MQQPCETQTPLLLVDNDNTLINGASKLNVNLLKVLYSYGLTNLTSFSSYDLTYRLKRSIINNYARCDVNRRVKYYGIQMSATVVSVSPYKEHELGHYYGQVIQPCELAAKRNYLALQNDSFMQTDSIKSLASSEISLIEQRITQPLSNLPVWQEMEYKGGKQHLLIHTILHYYAKGHRRFIIIDDKKEVHAVVQRAQNERLFGDEVLLTSIEVNFSENNEEPEQLYHNRIALAYQALNISLPSFVPVSTRKFLFLDVNSSSILNDIIAIPTWLKNYQEIHIVGHNAMNIAKKLFPKPTNENCVIKVKEVADDNFLERLEYRANTSELNRPVLIDWDYQFLGTPNPNYLTCLQQEVAEQPFLTAIVQGYQYLNAILGLLKEKTPSWYHTAFGTVESRIPVYLQLLSSPHHLVAKLQLLETLQIKKEIDIQDLFEKQNKPNTGIKAYTLLQWLQNETIPSQSPKTQKPITLAAIQNLLNKIRAFNPNIFDVHSSDHLVSRLMQGNDLTTLQSSWFEQSSSPSYQY